MFRDYLTILVGSYLIWEGYNRAYAGQFILAMILGTAGIFNVVLGVLGL
jgi:hypothetical protein